MDKSRVAREVAIAQAVKTAVDALYFADNSDYAKALTAILTQLDSELGEDLKESPSLAFLKAGHKLERAMGAAGASAASSSADAMPGTPRMQAPRGWHSSWLDHGYNGCISVAVEALSYLAKNERPRGGNERFNAEHLLQLSDELMTTRMVLLQGKSEQ